MIKWALLMFGVVLLFGCATPTILLLHPETGRVLECRPSGRYAPTLIGQIVTNKEIESCVKQFEALGFIRADKMTPEQRARVGATVRPPTSAASEPAGLNGTFTGDIQGMAYGKAFAMRVTFTLVQNGDQVVGVWNTTGGTSGTVSGLIRDQSLSVFRAKQVNPCEGELTGKAAIENNGLRLRGNYSGSDCNGSISAAFTVNRGTQ